MNKKCLIVFKWPIFLNKFIINKLSKFYNTEHLYISDYKNKNFSEITEEINKYIQSKNFEIVFFDVDSIKFINYFFIKKIKNVKKVLMTFDDTALHEMNAITANACDLIVTHCPFSVLKYKEKGYEAHLMCLENDGDIFKNYGLKKEIDVLFFGRINSERKEFLDFIINKGISIKIVGEDSDFVSLEELVKLMSKSKIVLNLSKTTTKIITNYSSESIYKFHYQLKGRVVMSGLSGTFCLSQYSPGQDLLFNKNEFPTFYTKDECCKILNKLLNNVELLEQYTNKFCKRIFDLYEEKRNFEPIFNAIAQTSNRKVELVKIPYWYLRIAAKQIIKRNIKLSSLLKSISQFKEIFEIIKNSNFYIKLLIIFETSINIIWYSFSSTIKNK